ncbi:hypothetical protein [Fodinibius sp.]|uniref:hypothetical protein n=1 Tax=Fodinibius sp. TaxID=1872440 RepID=UPI002ACDC61F|nr:hypothetical protein [Fodinibius sp.]MDZ7660514.1 hypothetical protein [Fodinibius sp.]
MESTADTTTLHTNTVTAIMADMIMTTVTNMITAVIVDMITLTTISMGIMEGTTILHTNTATAIMGGMKGTTILRTNTATAIMGDMIITTGTNMNTAVIVDMITLTTISMGIMMHKHTTMSIIIMRNMKGMTTPRTTTAVMAATITPGTNMERAGILMIIIKNTTMMNTVMMTHINKRVDAVRMNPRQIIATSMTITKITVDMMETIITMGTTLPGINMIIQDTIITMLMVGMITAVMVPVSCR